MIFVIALVVLAIVLLIMYKTKPLTTKVSKTQVDYMHDLLIKYEYDAVCRKINRVQEATVLSKQIKEMFPGGEYDHDLILEQITEPDKLIDSSVSC